jgi:hypothetical protein
MGNSNSAEANAALQAAPRIFTLHVWVPKEEVGLIIGKAGKTIQKIQKESGLQLNGGIVFPVRRPPWTVLRANSCAPQQHQNETSCWSEMKIKGEPSKCFAAFKLIEKLVAGASTPQ